MPSLDLTDTLVIAGAIAAITWVIWYFFFAEQRKVRGQEDAPGESARERARH